MAQICVSASIDSETTGDFLVALLVFLKNVAKKSNDRVTHS